MKQGKILGTYFLLLLMFSAITPVLFSKVDLSSRITVEQPQILQKKVNDLNDDKIDDELVRELNSNKREIIEVAIYYEYSIRPIDRYRLANFPISMSETWDLNRRIRVRVPRTLIYELATLPGVKLITSVEIRQIMVAIEGKDYSDLAVLETFDGAEIFWEVGCALVPYFSGIENDIKRLGSYTIISDVTDNYFKLTTSTEGHNNFEPCTEASVSTINATGLWDLGYTGAGVKVGVIDTGIADTHPDFSGRVLKKKSFILKQYGYEEEKPETIDEHGHGTHVSGTVLGDGTENPMNIGVAPQAYLIFARIGNPATEASMIAALNWAISKGVETVNLSFGGGDSAGDDVAEIAFNNAAKNKGVLCAISAGNSGADGYYTVGSPGTADDVITVGALDDVSQEPLGVAYYSSRALSANNHMKPDILAPGTNIVSCAKTGNGYVSMSGTSMASPHVAGAIALLIHACKANGIDYNPGLIKAALMKSAVLLTPLAENELMHQGRGYINVGAAWQLIKTSQRINNVPLIGACNPIQQPLSFWEELLQGQTAEQFLTCVSSLYNGNENLSLTISGEVSSFITIGELVNEWTAVTKVIFAIPEDTPLGTYTGQISYQYNDQVLDSVTIQFEVKEGNGHKMLLNYRNSYSGNSHMFGQYRRWAEDILGRGFVLSELNTPLEDPALLADYDAIWLPDPFAITFPQSHVWDFNQTGTYNPLSETELQNLRDFIADGGSLFINFIGYAEDVDFEGVIYGNNLTQINEIIGDYGMEAQSTISKGEEATAVSVITEHPITAEVEMIDHHGTSLVTSGEATKLTALSDSSPYGTLACWENKNGGRVIALSTNYALDLKGYENGYNAKFTQNDVLGRNLFRWATAHNQIERQSVTISEDNKTVTMVYQYLSGPGDELGGFVKQPDGNISSITWIETAPDIWTANYTCEIPGLHHFYPECGETKIDEFDYFSYEAYFEIPTITEETQGSGIASIIIMLVGSLGLSSWYMLSKRKDS
ncbi:MAG: S8 family serine peptidase [Candidatus Heimdallarchaeota archaeon]|nr:S8 family serine peptidase [Candidatus Heimdallarchaeota archaeon]